MLGERHGLVKGAGQLSLEGDVAGFVDGEGRGDLDSGRPPNFMREGGVGVLGTVGDWRGKAEPDAMGEENGCEELGQHWGVGGNWRSLIGCVKEISVSRTRSMQGRSICEGQENY